MFPDAPECTVLAVNYNEQKGSEIFYVRIRSTGNINAIWSLQVIAKLIDKCQTISREITSIQD